MYLDVLLKNPCSNLLPHHHKKRMLLSLHHPYKHIILTLYIRILLVDDNLHYRMFPLEPPYEEAFRRRLDRLAFCSNEYTFPRSYCGIDAYLIRVFQANTGGTPLVGYACIEMKVRLNKYRVVGGYPYSIMYVRL